MLGWRFSILLAERLSRMSSPILLLSPTRCMFAAAMPAIRSREGKVKAPLLGTMCPAVCCPCVLM